VGQVHRLTLTARENRWGVNIKRWGNIKHWKICAGRGEGGGNTVVSGKKGGGGGKSYKRKKKTM